MTFLGVILKNLFNKKFDSLNSPVHSHISSCLPPFSLSPSTGHQRSS
ncbi:hypothetical protein L798_14025 [Zootermopsis nevadensis]|uniref:Uncharacterized protein n=1 Tax=Zootermopsis nevadensis TaxID=136037 RepID=A0A067R1D0_ZOONE|nr:hypothetical protein L798_14025 [Zootermopsis nevadensis]